MERGIEGDLLKERPAGRPLYEVVLGGPGKRGESGGNRVRLPARPIRPSATAARFRRDRWESWITPLFSWGSGGPGFKSRRPDQLNQNKINSLRWHRGSPSLVLGCSCKSPARESAVPHACLFLGLQEPRYRLTVENGEPRQLDRIKPPFPTLQLSIRMLVSVRGTWRPLPE